MLILRIKIIITRAKVMILKNISFSPILIKSKLTKNIAKDLIKIDSELKRRSII